MAFHFRRTRWRGLVLIGIFLTALWLRASQMHQEEEHSFGRLTAMQVLALSAPICRSIAPDARELQLSAHAYSGERRWWSVLCQDQSGQEVAHLDWEAKTGELFEIGSWPYHPQDSRPTALDANEAAYRMNRWLSLLQPNVATGWRLSGKPVADYNRNWSAEWVHRNARCSIKIDGHLGELLLARFGTNKRAWSNRF